MTFLRSIGAPMLENRCLRVALGLACRPRPLRLTPRATGRGTLEPAGEEVTGQISDLIAGAFEQEVPAVEEMDLGRRRRRRTPRRPLGRRSRRRAPTPPKPGPGCCAGSCAGPDTAADWSRSHGTALAESRRSRA